jgi:acyl carrier protein
MIISDKRVAEVVSRLTGVPTDELKNGIPPAQPLFKSEDSLDAIELVVELEEEFDKKTIRLALRYVEALASPDRLAQRSKRPNSIRSDDSDPLWDRDLDG